MAAPQTIQVDVLIFGGGVAGLWILAHLTRQGYSSLLLESRSLGAGQTIASQGIIHGGVKYALGGQATDATKAIADMPRVWRDCLRGAGPVDLRTVPVLSEHQYLWTTPGLFSRVAGLGASMVMRTTVDRLAVPDRPGPLQGGKGIDVYRVDEPVLDSAGIVAALAAHAPDSVRSYAPSCVHFGPPDEHHAISSVELLDTPGPRGRTLLAIRPGMVIFAAGAGNQLLMDTMAQVPVDVQQQLRPLHMVMARNVPGPLFAHCLGSTSLPRLTITSTSMPCPTAHPSSPNNPETVWWIGGAIAEGEAVHRSTVEQIAAARKELAACLPWLDLGQLQLATSRWDRAEGVSQIESPPKRPDEPTIAAAKRWAVVWPTKLAFAPLVGDRLLALVRNAIKEPSGAHSPSTLAAMNLLPRAPMAPRPWEAAFDDRTRTWETIAWS